MLCEFDGRLKIVRSEQLGYPWLVTLEYTDQRGTEFITSMYVGDNLHYQNSVLSTLVQNAMTQLNRPTKTEQSEWRQKLEDLHLIPKEHSTP